MRVCVCVFVCGGGLLAASVCNSLTIIERKKKNRFDSIREGERRDGGSEYKKRKKRREVKTD